MNVAVFPPLTYASMVWTGTTLPFTFFNNHSYLKLYFYPEAGGKYLFILRPYLVLFPQVTFRI